ncbi:DUF4199 domain-containing protein [Rufibacter latericius]|uniref:DUF4199 domain-containing protein n=1 Tax=Rufibacter latericius TaxID=2487040 RepID=A0A3M9MH47_9BACT|nr:DUF4199 domain-containing protein [Rufibacter latericius]RNI24477.1 DUF4199 domain-containing protein [Rufibacter latericius]
MFDRAVINTAIRYGVTGGIVSVVYILLLAFSGFENPYDNASEYSSTFIFVSVFIFLGIKYFKKFYDAELGFAKAFKVGLLISFFLAFTAAMLLCIYSVFAGQEMIKEYIILSQNRMEITRQELVKVMGELNYKNVYQNLNHLDGFKLAQISFVNRMVAGFFISIVLGVFFRK